MSRIESGQSQIITQNERNFSRPEFRNWDNIQVTLTSTQPDKDKLAHIPSLSKIGDSLILKCKSISPEIPNNAVYDRDWLKTRGKIISAIKETLRTYCLENSSPRFYIDRMIHGSSYSDKKRSTTDILTHRLFLEAIEEFLQENPAWESTLFFLE